MNITLMSTGATKAAQTCII